MLCFRSTGRRAVICTTCVIEFTLLEYYFTDFYIYLLIVSNAIHVYCTRAFWDHRLEDNKGHTGLLSCFVLCKTCFSRF